MIQISVNLQFRPFGNTFSLYYNFISKKMTEHESFRMGVHSKPMSQPQRASRFIGVAADYSDLGIGCFNQCVDPDQKFDVDTIRGMEKRCMDGCLTVNLQNFTIYGTQYGQ
jgi:hypothetical protein